MTKWFCAILVLFGLMMTGTQPASAQVVEELGKKIGDECIRTAAPSSPPGGSITSMRRCCDDSMHRENKACKDDPKNVVCVNTAKICKDMVACDVTLNHCKIEAMKTDKDCSKDTCKKCTSDYKICHDSALR